ncbi:hypothetical protein C5167_015014 [Papaver somniferum]|uniref:Uncharacterized protein n=1 Tax=Papaver somniferum TaxID=3469 RepID=A0A4Y7J4T9_PAPSO|nr:hypothetical protein C5167_015014 [Papaver somniferum]
MVVTSQGPRRYLGLIVLAGSQGRQVYYQSTSHKAIYQNL